MKTKLAIIAAATAITLGAAGAASAATPAAKTLSVQGPATAKVQLVHHRHRYWRRHRHWRVWRIRHRRFCARMYFRGYVLGFPRARYIYNTRCRGHYGYWY